MFMTRKEEQEWKNRWISVYKNRWISVYVSLQNCTVDEATIIFEKYKELIGTMVAIGKSEEEVASWIAGLENDPTLID